jgi:radical SAM protein with 4Fe4S-binding SPASM domain
VQLLDSTAHCGNVRETPLSSILAANDLLLKFRERKELKGKCGRCRYKHTCGGCRAIAYYKTGDYLESDPNCFFEPENESTVSEHEQLQNEKADKFINFISGQEPWKALFNSTREKDAPGTVISTSPKQYVIDKIRNFIGALTGK